MLTYIILSYSNSIYQNLQHKIIVYIHKHEPWISLFLLNLIGYIDFYNFLHT